jgi:outer membrane protein assembly factor BamB
MLEMMLGSASERARSTGSDGWTIPAEMTNPRKPASRAQESGMFATRCSTAWVLVSALTAIITTGLRADDNDTWPQWRGPQRNGRVHGGPWPASLQDPHLTPLFRIELPPSYSGPVVAEGKLFVTYTKDAKYEGVRALDPDNGRELWSTEWDDSMQVAEVAASMGSWIRATPTYYDRSLYVAGMRDLLVCLDAETGSQRWQADFHQRYGTPLPEIGFVCSPLVVDDGVFVQAADSFIRVDRRTGASVWRCLVRSDVGQGSYSSPDFAVIHGRPQLLVANIPAIAGVDPATGDILWKRELDSYDQGCILAPIPYADGIFTSTRASRTGFYRLSYHEGRFTLADQWKNKLVVYMSSPVVIGDHAWLHLKNGRFACVDLQNGKEKWISNRPYGKYCSMIWCHNQILALTNEGQLLLIRANSERFDLADSRVISTDETWGHLAVVGQQIFIRELNAIAVYHWH